MLDTLLKCLHVLTHSILITALWGSIIRWGPGNGHGEMTCPDSSPWQAVAQGSTPQRLCFYWLHRATSAKVAKTQVILYFLIFYPCIILTTSDRQADRQTISSSAVAVHIPLLESNLLVLVASMPFRLLRFFTKTSVRSTVLLPLITGLEGRSTKLPTTSWPTDGQVTQVKLNVLAIYI